MDLNREYDTILEAELEKVLRRKPSDNELKSADFDSNLVNETFWQLLEKMNQRITELEKK